MKVATHESLNPKPLGVTSMATIRVQEHKSASILKEGSGNIVAQMRSFLLSLPNLALNQVLPKMFHKRKPANAKHLGSGKSNHITVVTPDIQKRSETGATSMETLHAREQKQVRTRKACSGRGVQQPMSKCKRRRRLISVNANPHGLGKNRLTMDVTLAIRIQSALGVTSVGENRVLM
jgi:hypothetical protein